MSRAVQKKSDMLSTARPRAWRNATLKCVTTCLLVTAVLPALAQTASKRDHYQQVIEAARAGRHDWALERLAEQAALEPDNLRIKYDQLIITGWTGRSAEVLQLYQNLPPNALPLPRAALSAVARAYRDEHQWTSALELYREGKQRFPGDKDFDLGETLVLADSGEADVALQSATQLVNRSPRDPSRLVALSYALRLNNQPYAALEAATKAYTIAPKNRSVVEEYISALSAAGLSEAALRTAQGHAELVPESRLRSLQLDRAAELTRLSSQEARQESERFKVATRALQAYDSLTVEPSPFSPPADPVAPTESRALPEAVVKRARVDRLLALHSRVRMQDVVAEYENLLAEGIEVPSYALGHVADAYLEQRQPEKAAQLYLQILNDERAHIDPAVRLSRQSGLFYSYIESEQFDAAQTVMSEALIEQPAWRWQKGTPLPQPNDLNLAASQYVAMGHHYADDLEQAQVDMEALVARAPGHSGLRSSLAQVYLARGWPRRAEEELKLAETHTPQSIQVITEQARTAMNLQEWEQADILIQNAVGRYPENLHVQRLLRDWERHNRAELRLSATRGLAGDSPVAGNHDLNIDTVIYSPPVAYNWRGFAGGGFAQADFDDYDADYHWYRGGAEWRSRNLTAEAEVSSNHYGQGAKVGARIQADYDLNDQWRIGGQVAFRSRETPLKALANDITSNRLDAYVRWRASERREWSFRISPSKFSDGNRRLELGIAGNERVYTAPHLKLDAHLDIAASHNTLDETPYFNPRADLTVLPSLSLTHTVYRRYETVIEQRFTLGGGLYSQRGYGSGAIAMLGYGLRLRLNERLDAGVSILGVSRPYDGVREREARVMFDLQFRF